MQLNGTSSQVLRRDLQQARCCDCSVLVVGVKGERKLRSWELVIKFYLKQRTPKKHVYQRNWRSVGTYGIRRCKDDWLLKVQLADRVRLFGCKDWVNLINFIQYDIKLITIIQHCISYQCIAWIYISQNLFNEHHSFFIIPHSGRFDEHHSGVWLGCWASFPIPVGLIGIIHYSGWFDEHHS